MRKVKCWILQIANINLLVCREQSGIKDYCFSPKYNTWGKRMLYLGDDVLKVLACDSHGHQQDIAFLPEFVMEAYNKGVREFEIIYDTKTEVKEELRYDRLGLLQVTYDRPTKETFTREEVIAIIGAIDTIETRDEIQEWLDTYK